MPTNEQLTELKNEIKASIRRNSDRGFVPYSGCNRVCHDMMSILEIAEVHPDPRHAFDISIMVLLEAVKLLSHADDSSGAAGDVIYSSTDMIDKRCLMADEADQKHFMDTLLKTAKNKVFRDWPDFGYKLLKSAVHLVRDEKQAQKVYEVIPLLGQLYDGKDYPDKHLITVGIIERLEGDTAANQYLMEHIDVPELRVIAVEKALEAKQYPLAEELCNQALKKDNSRLYKTPVWAYYLERLYRETSNLDKLTETINYILFHGDPSYYTKLKELYQKQEIWEQMKEPLLKNLSVSLMIDSYASLLAIEGEFPKLLDVVIKNPYMIVDYGKQLAQSFSEETYVIYVDYIEDQAKEATERRKYKEVCKIIKNFHAAGAKSEANQLIDRLCERYPRRPAMQEELAGLRRKLK